MRPEDVPDALIDIFETAFGEADGLWSESLAAGVTALTAAIRAQVAEEIEAAAPEVTTFDPITAARVQGMERAAKIARGDA